MFYQRVRLWSHYQSESASYGDKGTDVVRHSSHVTLTHSSNYHPPPPYRGTNSLLLLAIVSIVFESTTKVVHFQI